VQRSVPIIVPLSIPFHSVPFPSRPRSRSSLSVSLVITCQPLGRSAPTIGRTHNRLCSLTVTTRTSHTNNNVDRVPTWYRTAIHEHRPHHRTNGPGPPGRGPGRGHVLIQRTAFRSSEGFCLHYGTVPGPTDRQGTNSKMTTYHARFVRLVPSIASTVRRTCKQASKQQWHAWTDLKKRAATIRSNCCSVASRPRSGHDT
jgi:hypothetical protein